MKNLYKDKATDYEKILYGLTNNVFGKSYTNTSCVHTGSESRDADAGYHSSDRPCRCEDCGEVCRRCKKFMKKLHDDFCDIGVKANEDIWKETEESSSSMLFQVVGILFITI